MLKLCLHTHKQKHIHTYYRYTINTTHTHTCRPFPSPRHDALVKLQTLRASAQTVIPNGELQNHHHRV